jgi:pimeloyl-ACP methyl ester carboxylesterase
MVKDRLQLVKTNEHRLLFHAQNPIKIADQMPRSKTSLIQTTSRFAAIACAACMVFFTLTSLWNVVAENRRKRQNPAPGDFYSIDAKPMHLVCAGTGAPTVVLESAASARWTQWRKVQPLLSQVTRVCSYDRAGHGWSDPRSGPRDAETIVRELHTLLDRANVKRPFIYVGESAGGLYVREYAREFPADVAGVALIDASSPQQIDELPGFRTSWEADKRKAPQKLWEDRIAIWSGWERLLGHCTNPANAVDCRPAFVDMDENELAYFETSCHQAGRLNSFGNIPLLIITAEKSIMAGKTAEESAQGAVWEREQEALKSLSRMSWRVIARGSGHIVPIDRPALVIAEMTRMVTYLRGGPAPPANTTATE